MTRRQWPRGASVLLALALVYGSGCSKNPTRVIDGIGAPETELTYAPFQSDTTFFRVHLYWSGYDDDGEVVGFRFAVDGDTAKPLVRWRFTTAQDSEFTFAVRPGDLVGGHVFWVTALDNEGRYDLSPAKRYFSIHTQPPVSSFTSGPLAGAVTGPSVTFAWTGTDPDGGPTGSSVPADSFEYLLLFPGASFDGNHTPLPAVTRLQTYVDLINQASGESLPPPYEDWRWTGTSAASHRFTGLVPGYYILAIRAVDAAGAHDLVSPRMENLRYFYVTTDAARRSPPLLTINGDLLTNPLANYYDPYANAYAPVAARIPVLEGDAASFSWTGAPGATGEPIAGFMSALDDTSTDAWSHPDPASRGLTLPASLTPGAHALFVRVVDEAGTTTTAVLTLEVVHAAFRDPARPGSVLYVDDFAPPPGDCGAATRGSLNFPTDSEEDTWWTATILSPLAREFGIAFEQWDPVLEGTASADGQRLAPSLQQLAEHRVVIWSVDFNNTISSPVAFWTTIAYENASTLRAYLRGGGTLIVTGFQLASSASRNTEAPYGWSGICAFDRTGTNWRGTYFARNFMGIDGAVASDEGSRRLGARDFVAARVTPAGASLGFATASLDVGGSDAKWDSTAFGLDDARLAPGLPKVEGWKLEATLGCNASESRYRRENPSLPIASPIFTYHGVKEGVLENLGTSPREGLVVGIATQAHDNGAGDGSLVTPGNARGVIGRMVFLGFPIYYMKDAEAYAVMRAAFAYVNGSPTLVGGTP